jgi:proline iminopeptidase
MAFARIVTHYFHHKAWLGDGELIGNAHRLAGIPGILIHGARDISTPLDTASELARAWPSAELTVVDEAGHETKTPAMLEKIVEALDRFAQERPRATLD